MAGLGVHCMYMFNPVYLRMSDFLRTPHSSTSSCAMLSLRRALEVSALFFTAQKPLVAINIQHVNLEPEIMLPALRATAQYLLADSSVD